MAGARKKSALVDTTNFLSYDESIPQADMSSVVDEDVSAYAVYTILSRAIPDIRDGLKPVHRRLMYQMNLSNLGPMNKHWKLAKVSGLVTGTFHPHGGSSVDGTAAYLSEEWTQRLPLVDIHGNNGNIQGGGPAASRYIEARMAPAASLFNLDAVKRNAVDMRDNYDGTAQEPVVLPSLIPFGAINGVLTGIATGVSTTIVPHNPVEIIKMQKLAVQGRLTLASAKKVYHGPDFPTGNELIDSDIHAELTSPKAKYKVRARYHFEKNVLVIDEVPYGVSTEKLIENAVKVINGNIPEVTAIHDMTDSIDDPVGVRIEIVFKKSITEQRMKEIGAFLEKKNVLVTSLDPNNLFIAEGRPQYLNLIDQMKIFADFFRETHQRIWEFEKEKAEGQLALRQAERVIVMDITALKALLEKAKSKDDLKQRIIKKWKFSDEVAEYIATMQVHRLLRNDAPRIKALDEAIAKQEGIIAERELWLGDGQQKKLLSICDESIKAIQEMGLAERRTLEGESTPDISIDKVVSKAVPSLDRVVSVSTIGPVIKAATTGETGDDWLTVDTKTDKFIAAVTRSGQVVVRQVIDLDKAEERVNRTIADISADDSFVAVFELQEGRYAVTFSEFGYMKRVPHEKIWPSTGTRAYVKKTRPISGVRNGDSLVAVHDIPGNFKGSFTVQSPTRKDDQLVSNQDVLGRSDSGGSNGARYFKTRDGKDVVSAVIVNKK